MTAKDIQRVAKKTAFYLGKPQTRIQYRDETYLDGLGHTFNRVIAEVVRNSDKPEDKPFPLYTIARGPGRCNVSDLSSDFYDLKDQVAVILEAIES